MLLFSDTEKSVCPKVAKYGAECPFDVDNECLSDQECSGSRKCCPSPYDDEACQLLCLEPITQSELTIVILLLDETFDDPVNYLIQFNEGAVVPCW